MVTIDEERRRRRLQDDHTDAIRMALLTHNPANARLIIPEYFDALLEEPEESNEDNLDFSSTNTNFDLSGVTWESPQDMNTGQFGMLEQLLADQHITVRETPDPPEGVREGR